MYIRCILILALCLSLSAPLAAQSPQTPLSAVFTPRKKAVISAEVPGQVVKIEKEFGQGFGGKAVLVRLDPALYQFGVSKARAALERARVNFEAMDRLYRDNTRSAMDFAAAKSDLAMAQANLGLAEKELASCVVAAPYPGRVAKVLVNEHEWVERGKPLLEILDERGMLAKVLIPAAVVRELKTGQALPILVELGGLRVSGKISHISAQIDSVSQTQEVYLDVDNADGRLLTGMTGKLLLPDPR